MPRRPSGVSTRCASSPAAARLAGFDREELGDELGLEDVQAAALGVGVAPGADLGGAGVVDHLGLPRLFDALPHGRLRTAGLAGDDDPPHREVVQADLVLGRHLDQPQRVARRAAQHGGAGALHQLQPGERIHAAAGNRPARRGPTSASCAVQKPMNGPNENASIARSSAVTSAASSTYCQQSIHHCQSSAVSSTGSGRPCVPEVWWNRT